MCFTKSTFSREQIQSVIVGVGPSAILKSLNTGENHADDEEDDDDDGNADDDDDEEEEEEEEDVPV